MNRPLLLLWTLLIVAATALLLLARMWNAQHMFAAEQRAEQILLSQLSDPARRIDDVFAQYDRDLGEALSNANLNSIDECLQLARLPTVQLLVVVNDADEMVYPQSMIGRSEAQAALIAETLGLLREFGDPRPTSRQARSQTRGQTLEQPEAPRENESARQQSMSASEDLQLRSYGRGVNNFQPNDAPAQEIQQAEPATAASPRENARNNAPGADNLGAGEFSTRDEPANDSSGNFTPKQGWITWYHRRGMMLGYLSGKVGPGQNRGVAIVPRARWMADIVASLPNSGSPFLRELPPVREAANRNPSPFEQCIWQLTDVEGKVIYKWSTGKSNATDSPDSRRVEQALAAPLEGWRLALLAPPEVWDTVGASGDSRIVWIGVLGLIVGMLAVGLLISLNLNRQMKLARQRVSFVNQVSHELRTPLTNIRMYAELLDREIEHESGTGKLSVIRNEARRLGRLIDNVLVFAKAGKARLQLKPTQCDVDAIIREVVETFRPRLTDAGMSIQLDLQVPSPQWIDAAVVEQILVNLIANAENYAASGKLLRISSTFADFVVTISVRDFGGGVPAKLRERIFQPFVRSSDRIDAPAGTGIGLSIVRELTALHGGKCTLTNTSPGAEFVVTLAARESKSKRP